MTKSCPYCESTPKLVTGKEIYPHRPDLYHKKFYLCNCGAYVGCHPNSDTPLGAVADEATRKARNKAHAAFDPIWKHKQMRRNDAYAKLAQKMGINRNECHIGMFDVQQCQEVVDISKFMSNGK